ncbi:Alpha/Beta hydrolase protein [Aspergillus oleicola]
MGFLKLNVEEEPSQELQGQYHLVVSSNCVHATRNLHTSLSNIRKLLRPDNGCLALLELTQKLPWYELVWGLLDGWWLFGDGREYALQTPWAWEKRYVMLAFYTLTAAARDAPKPAGRGGDRPWPIKATSMLVHRPDASSHPTLSHSLFLAPDGRGYGTVFDPLGQHLAGASLPISVYALNSPFTTTNHTLHSGYPIPTAEEMASSYVAEIKRRQPQGPYLLGGYSFGGIISIEIARQLLEAGDEVSKLLLIDSACPTWAVCPPDSLFEYLHSNLPAGVNLTKTRAGPAREQSSGTKGPDGYQDHDDPPASGEDGISMSGHQLRRYKPKKLPSPASKRPHTILISARDGLDHGKETGLDLETLAPEERKTVNRFLHDRVDDSTLGWEDFMGAGNVTVIRADSNHFNVVLPLPTMGEWVSELVRVLDV